MVLIFDLNIRLKIIDYFLFFFIYFLVGVLWIKIVLYWVKRRKNIGYIKDIIFI